MALTKNDLKQFDSLIKTNNKGLLKTVCKGVQEVVERKVGNLAAMTSREFNRIRKENKRRFDLLESGQEDIKLRLDNVAYRFELIVLQKRVDRLEEKVGMKK